MTADAKAGPETERVRRHYETIAGEYDHRIASFERMLVGDGRRKTCSIASGRTLEVAIGTGRNLEYYASDVRLTGVDVSPAMLDIAGLRARELGREVDLRVGDAQALDFADEGFDTVVCTLALCTVPDERRALAEAYRVLRPGGRILLLEHVRSHIAPVRWLERLLDPVAVRVDGDHLTREPLDHLGDLGFSVERCERSKWGFMEATVARKD